MYDKIHYKLKKKKKKQEKKKKKDMRTYWSYGIEGNGIFVILFSNSPEK